MPLIVRNAKSGRELHLGLWQAGNGIMSFSPDGKFLACAGDQSTQIRLWDFERQALRYLPRNHTGGVLALAFSPDGKTLASAGLDQTVRLWEVPSGQEIAILDGLTVNATLLGFTADGKSLISAAAAARQYASKPVPGEVKVWDLGTHKQRSGFALTEPSECLALSPDGATLVAAGPGGKVAVWDVMAAKQCATLTAGAWVYAAAFSSDGKSLATSYQNEPPRLWDLATGQERKDFFHSKPSLKWTCRPSALAFSADGKTLYAVGYFMVAPGPNEYALWNFDAVTGEDRGPVGSSLSADLAAGVGRYNLVASDSSSDGKVLATAWNQLVDVWELTAKPGGRVAGHLRTTLVQGPNSNIRQMVVSPDGNSVATADNTTAYLWDTRTGRQSTLWDSKPAPVSALQFSPDAKRLAVAAGNEIRLFDTETGVTKRCLTGLRVAGERPDVSAGQRNSAVPHLGRAGQAMGFDHGRGRPHDHGPSHNARHPGAEPGWQGRRHQTTPYTGRLRTQALGPGERPRDRRSGAAGGRHVPVTGPDHSSLRGVRRQPPVPGRGHQEGAVPSGP